MPLHLHGVSHVIILQCTPLMYSLQFEFFDIFNKLIEKGADLAAGDNNGVLFCFWIQITALHYSVQFNRLEYVKVLLAKGIDIDIKSVSVLRFESARCLFIFDQQNKQLPYLPQFKCAMRKWSDFWLRMVLALLFKWTFWYFHFTKCFITVDFQNVHSFNFCNLLHCILLQNLMKLGQLFSF